MLPRKRTPHALRPGSPDRPVNRFEQVKEAEVVTLAHLIAYASQLPGTILEVETVMMRSMLTGEKNDLNLTEEP